AKTCGLLSLFRLNLWISCFVSEPREPSARIVIFARISIPGSKLPRGFPDWSIPLSPVRTPVTVFPSMRSSSPANPANISTPLFSTCSPDHRPRRGHRLQETPVRSYPKRNAKGKLATKRHEVLQIPRLEIASLEIFFRMKQ